MFTRITVFGLTIIACVALAEVYLVVTSDHRGSLAEVGHVFYLTLILFAGYCLVAFPVLRQFFSGVERTEEQVDRERWGCAGIILLAILLALTTFVRVAILSGR